MQRAVVVGVIPAGLVLTLVLPLSLATGGRTAASKIEIASVPQCATTPLNTLRTAKQRSHFSSLITALRQVKTQESAMRLLGELACYPHGSIVSAGPGGGIIVVETGTYAPKTPRYSGR